MEIQTVMGIDLELAGLLIDEISLRNLRGSILTLGRQELNFSFSQLVKKMGLAGPGPVNMATISFTVSQRAILDEFESAGHTLSNASNGQEAGTMTNDFFFRFIGFERVTSVDYSDYDGADITYDLNIPGLGRALGTFDVIWDAGTMEHIFHIPNFMANIHDALEIGGTAMHIIPANGMVDHGFYQISPTFFADYYGVNAYSDIQVEFCLQSNGFILRRDYYPHMLNDVMGGGLGGARYLSRCNAKKVAASTCDRIPQQRDFQGVWHTAKSKSAS